MKLFDTQVIKRYPLRILLAEDVVVNQYLVLDLLRLCGYSAEVANNGIEVLQAVHDKDFDVILMDIQMPEMDGLEATRRIFSEIELTRRPDIVALTANASKKDRNLYFESGMIACVRKPVQVSALKTVLSQVTYRKMSKDKPGIVVEEDEDDALSPSGDSISLHPLRTYIDHDVLKQLLHVQQTVNPNIFVDLQVMFQDDAPQLLEAMKSSLDSKDPIKLKFNAHNLKGVCANMGAKNISSLCQELEKIASSPNLDNAINLFKMIDSSCRVFLTALQKESRLDTIEKLSTNRLPAGLIPATSSAKRILIVDDHRINRYTLAQHVIEMGHVPLEASNGQEALHKIETEPLDLVLTDIQMPELDGVTLLKILEEKAILQHIPVIMVSGVDDLQTVVDCVEHGADDFLTKPISLPLLKARISSSLEKKALRDQERRLLEETRLLNERLVSTNAELEAVNKSLSELNNEKSEILGIAAHDLKNPIATILINLGTARRRVESMPKEKVMQTLGMIEESCHRMTNIIVNLLDINKIESGKFSLESTVFSPHDCFQQVFEIYKTRAEDKGIQLFLENHVPPDTSLCIDKNAFSQILDNLVSNAVKYSPQQKQVFFRQSLEDGLVKIVVQDQGPGLSVEDKQKLFGKFQRLSAKPTGGEHSTGLGLSIVKRLCDLMGGRVRCESEIGQGASFILEFPAHG